LSKVSLTSRCATAESQPLASHRKCVTGAESFFFLGRFRYKLAHFCNGNRGENPDEQKDQHDKHADGTNEGGPIPEGGLVAAPCGRVEVAGQADDHDDKTLEPHTSVHDDRHDEEDHDVVAHLVRPQQLRRQDVANNQRVVERSIRTVQPLLDKEDVEFVSAIDGKEKLEEVAVGHDKAGGEHDLGHVIQMAHGDVVFEAIRFSQRNCDANYHSEARIDSAGHEIGRKDGGVPAGNN